MIFHTNRKRLFSPARCRHGKASVEFALIAPVLFLLLFGLFEASRAVMVRQAITNAAREGCRTATLATTTSDQRVKDRILEFLSTTIANTSDPDTVDINVKPSDLSNLPANEPVTVTVSVSYSDVSWLPPMFIGDTQIFGSATMEKD